MNSTLLKNVGHDDLVFLAICTPRFSGDVYEDLEGEVIFKTPPTIQSDIDELVKEKQ